MILLSPCCKSAIGIGTREESPLGDRFTIGYRMDVCADCGKEVEQPIEGCDNCGEPSVALVKVPYGDYCATCDAQTL